MRLVRTARPNATPTLPSSLGGLPTVGSLPSGSFWPNPVRPPTPPLRLNLLLDRRLQLHIATNLFFARSRNVVVWAIFQWWDSLAIFRLDLSQCCITLISSNRRAPNSTWLPVTWPLVWMRRHGPLESARSDVVLGPGRLTHCALAGPSWLVGQRAAGCLGSQITTHLALRRCSILCGRCLLRNAKRDSWNERLMHDTQLEDIELSHWIHNRRGWLRCDMLSQSNLPLQTRIENLGLFAPPPAS